MVRRPVAHTHLQEQVGHDGVVHHGSLCPLGRPVTVGVQQAAIVVPAREVVPEQEVRPEGVEGFWGRSGGKVQEMYLSLNCSLSLADGLALKT